MRGHRQILTVLVVRYQNVLNRPNVFDTYQAARGLREPYHR